MDLPSTRELELEALLRQRDAQILELSDDIKRLRRYISNQQGPSPTDPVTLPPSIVSILGTQLRSSIKESTAAGSTVINALVQKTRLLQEENDELYEILNLKETGKLKEEVRGLRRVVQRLESGLRESHTVINALSTELDKTHEALMASSKHVSPVTHSDERNASHSPRNTYRDLSSVQSSNPMGNGPLKPLPTGPRAFKKARLSDSHSQSSPPPSRPQPSASHRQHGGASNIANSMKRSGIDQQHHSRDQVQHLLPSYSNDRDRDRSGVPGLPNKPQLPAGRSAPNQMDVDEDKREKRSRPALVDRERDRQRGDGLPGGSVDAVSGRDSYEKDRGPRDRDRERGGGKDRGRERAGTRERERGETTGSRSSQGTGGRRNGGPHASNHPGRSSGMNHRRNAADRASGTGVSSNRDSHSLDRTLAERMGL